VPASVGTLSALKHGIFSLVTEGRSNADVAQAALVRGAMVKTHVCSILTLLELSSRSALIALAHRTGPITPSASH
jgi:DNA-binding NarL/FixJ family response regulator